MPHDPHDAPDPTPDPIPGRNPENSPSPLELPDADAMVRFAMSSDGMRLGVNRHIPALGRGRPITGDAIRRQLAAAGVTLEPVPGAPERIAAALAEDADVSRIVLVRGVPAQEPRDARIVPEGDPRFPVFPGMACARLEPAVRAQSGHGIDGRRVDPRSRAEPADLTPHAGEHCSFDGRTFTADAYGRIEIDGDSVRVVPLLELNEDRTALRGAVYWRDNLERLTTPALFEDVLHRLGVTAPLNAEAVEAAIQQAGREGSAVEGVDVALGRPAVPWRDARLEMLVRVPGEVGTTTAGDRVDYRDRGERPICAAGQAIAVLHPPEPGESGLDVFGRAIIPRRGRELSVRCGENVTRSDDGVFRAQKAGLVVHARGGLSVTDCLLVDGDVNLGTGHIHVDLGSVRVRGTVQAGLRVQAKEHVVVDQAVEAADILAGGDVSVRAGALMGEGEGRILAEGDVRVGFAVGAIIEAGGCVDLGSSATNCRVSAKGPVLAVNGKGVIQGGTITSESRIEAQEIGSELGVATQVSIGGHLDTDVPLLHECAELHHKLERIGKVLGNGDPRDILRRADPAERPKVAELLKLRIRLAEKLKNMKLTVRKHLAQRREALLRARIVARRVIHPGVTIRIAGRRMLVTAPIPRSQIFYDPETKELKVTGL